MSTGDTLSFQNQSTETFSTPLSVVWVSVFQCSGYTDVVKPFYESITHTSKPTTTELTSIVQNSFEMAGFTSTMVEVSKNLDQCKVTIPLKTEPAVDLVVRIKTKPALKIGEQLFKLEEFEI